MTTYSDGQLEFSSNHLIYHIKMYVETFLWLQNHPRTETWDTVRNAVIESHLIHARILIHFVQRNHKNNLPQESKKKNKQPYTDVFAVDYFDDLQDFLPLQNDFLTEVARDKIGGQLVHLTTNSSLLKSEQAWQIGEIATSLTPVIRQFLTAVPNHRLPLEINQECKDLIDRVSSKPSDLKNLFSTKQST
jgi:hypothetical protein